jgi:RHS repeat-associated protein
MVPNTDQANFPVLVSGTYSYLATTANGGNVTNSNGYDIIFTSDAAGSTVIPFEREAYSPTTGAAIYWVQLPALSHITDTTFYIFYGNSSVTTDQSNKNGVWDSNFQGVWHLQETSGQQHDSTSNANNSTGVSVTTEGSAAGEVGGADQFNASHPDHVDLPNIALTTGFTLEFWMYPTSFTSYERMITKEFTSNSAPWYDYGLTLDTSSTQKLDLGFDQAGTLLQLISTRTVSLNQWTHVVGTYDGANLKIYVNGTLDSSAAASGTIATISQSTEIGYNNVYTPQSFTGNLDEARISSVARSADWIATEYNNESSPSTFFSVGLANAPVITSLSPTSGTVTTSVTITGASFGSTQGSSTVTFNGTTGTPTSWSDTSIVVPVPSGSSTGNVLVTAGGVASNEANFTVQLPYSYNHAITISHTMVPNTDQTNFPVLVSGTYPYLATTAHGGGVTNSSGYDIIFTSDSAGLDVLPFERESYSPTTGAVVYWVEIPTLSHTTDTTFYMFYGNSSITTDQSNKNGVWDGNYQGVWHLQETSGRQHDSTSNGNNSTGVSVTTEGSATGKIGGADQFTGSHPDHVDLPNISLTSAFTLQFWIYPTSYTDYDRMFSKAFSTNTAPWYDYGVTLDTAASQKLDLGIDHAGTLQQLTSAGVLPLNQWTYVDGTYDGSNLRIYINGVLDSTQAASGSIDAVSQPTELGYNTVYTPQSFTGNLDEARISSVARSADWIAAEYNNESNPAAFYSLAATPGIGSLSPISGLVGTSVTVSGSNFGSSQGSSTVTFNGTAATVISSWSNTQIIVQVPTGATKGNVVVTVGGVPSNGLPFSIFPTGWLDQDVGPVGLSGSSSYASGTFTVSGAGNQIGSTADGMHFVYQPLSGDGTIVARVVSVEPGGTYAQAGVMIRETLASNATMAYVGNTPQYGNSYFTYRTTTGASANSSQLTAPIPYWVKLVRSGSTFTAYQAADGVNWVQIGSAQTISMATNVYIGLAVSSDNEGALTTATFDNVSINSTAAPAPVITAVSATTGSIGSQVVISGSGFGATEDNSIVSLNAVPMTISSWSATSITITIPTGATSGYMVVSVAPSMNDSNPVVFEVTAQPLPTSWLDQDVGSVGRAGSATYANGTFTVNAAGWQIGSTADGMHFVYQPLSGDGTIVARVISVDPSGTYAQAGVMIRETLASNATMAYVGNTPQYGNTYFTYRTTTGASANSSQLTAPIPYWVELVRSGSTFTAYMSSDGVSWTQVGSSETISMATNVYIGLAVSSDDASYMTTATFDNVSINSTALPAPVITSVSATTGSIGSDVVISGTGFGASESGSLVLLNDSPVTINSWSSTSITITIPTAATSGYMAVSVAPSMNDSNPVFFTVTTEPLPTGWLDEDVGSVGRAGSASYVSGAFTVNAAGWQIGSTTDEMHYVYQSLAGNGTIIARVVSVEPSGTYAQAGVMIRETLDSDAKMAYLGNQPVNGGPNQFIYRTSTGGSATVYNGGNVSLPYWMMLIRNGSTFTAFAGPDGVNWTQVGSAQTISMATDVYVGLAASSDDASYITTAVFDNVSVSSSTALPPVVITSLSPPAAPIGGTVTVNGTSFGTSQGSSTLQVNGVTVTTSAWSSTAITFTVPSGTTTGPVVVTVGGLASNSVTFTLIEALSITGISPTSGPTTTAVTITGTGFGPTQSSSAVNFYGATATSITSWSDTSIVVPVPAGAVTGNVTVTVAGVTDVGPVFELTTPVVTLTDSLGNMTTYVAAVAGGQWLNTEAEGSGCSGCSTRGTIYRSFDSNGNILSTTDALGLTTTNSYDSHDDLTSVVQPTIGSTSPTTSYTYNSFGEVLTATDPLGHVTTNTYDSNGNLLTVTTPAPGGGASASVTHFAYNSLGELTQITDPLGNVTTMTYTTAGYIATITDAQSHVTTYGYNARGDRTSVTDALSHETTFAYDSMDRLTSITYPDSTTTSFTYDSRGRRTSVTDQNGKTTSYAYDSADRLTSVTDAASNVTTYAYDTENNLTSITDANSHETAFTYDAFGRVTETNFPSSHTETYDYDADNNLTSKTDRKAQTITYLYDALNRLTEKTYPDTTTVEYTYDLVGKVTEVNDPTGTYAFAYDNMGRLVGTTTSYSFLTSRSFTNAYTYDAASNRTGFTDPESGSTTYAYDSLNRLTTLAPPSAFSSGSFGFSYDALSRRTQMTRPNSVTTNYTYDNLSRLLSVLHQAGGSTIDGASYTLDSAGNRTAKVDDLASVTSDYTYDPIYELTQVTQAATTTESYSYDPVGNRTASLGVSSYTTNVSNELTATSSASYAYDTNGNTTSKTDSTGTTDYSWDYENRLTSVTLPDSGGTVTFKYDPLGRRIYKQSPSATSIFVYDGDNLIETVNSTGAVVARYTQTQDIDEPLAELRSGSTSYYEADGLGSVTSLTGSGGAVASSYTFDSFGNVTNSSGTLSNPFRYAAREFDGETNLYYYRARYYDSQTGKFLQEDPSGLAGGINSYAYTMNSPTDWTDPTGLAMSAEECTKLLQDIQRRSKILSKKLASYDPVTDGLGDAPYQAGGKMGMTKPGTHYAQIVGMQINLAIDIVKYQNGCKNGPKIPPCTFEPVYKKIPQPVYPETMLELQLDEESARDMESFWNDIVFGDALLGAGYFAPGAVAGASAGAGAWGWVGELGWGF